MNRTAAEEWYRNRREPEGGPGTTTGISAAALVYTYVADVADVRLVDIVAVIFVVIVVIVGVAIVVCVVVVAVVVGSI